MSRYGNVTILPAEPNPWDSLSLIGSIMGKNAAGRQDAKDVDAMVEGITPGLLTNSNSTVQATANPNISPQSATTGGLLSGNTLKGNINASLAPNTSFLGSQIQPTTQANTTQAQTVAQPQTTQQTQAKPQTWADVENQYNQAWAQKAKGILAKMSPEGRKQYMSQIMATREQGLNDLKTQWTKQETANNWDAFNQETDPKKKLFYAVKNGMDVKSAQMLLDPDTETQLVDMGGQKVLIGKNKYTNQYTNMMTGQPLTADDLKNTMTEYQAGTLANQQAETNAKIESGYFTPRSYGSSGGVRSSGGNKANLSPEEKWATNYEVSSSGLTKDQAVIDSLYDAPYLTPAQQTQLNQALANRDKYWRITSGGEYDTGDSSSDGAGIDYNSFIRNAMANGYTQEQADAYWKENAGS